MQIVAKTNDSTTATCSVDSMNATCGLSISKVEWEIILSSLYHKFTYLPICTIDAISYKWFTILCAGTSIGLADGCVCKHDANAMTVTHNHYHFTVLINANSQQINNKYSCNCDQFADLTICSPTRIPQEKKKKKWSERKTKHFFELLLQPSQSQGRFMRSGLLRCFVSLVLRGIISLKLTKGLLKLNWPLIWTWLDLTFP